jgi:hypothetical protein
MATPTAKELKKLAKACRDAGIHYFKGDGFEFTLNGVAPEKPVKGKAPLTHTQGDIETDAPTDEEILYWSSMGGNPFSAFEGIKE